MERYINRNWLNRLLGRLQANGSISGDSAAAIKGQADADNDYALYNGLNSILGLLGCVLAIGGLMVILADATDGKGSIMAPMPLILTGALYFYYTSAQKASKLWKEVASALLFVGFSVSFPMMINEYGLDFIGSALQTYIILAAGLYLIYANNSLITCYVYLMMLGYGLVGMLVGSIAGAFLPYGAAGMVSSAVGLSGTGFWVFIYWLFLAAVLPYIKGRIEGKELGLKEAILGYLTVSALFTFATVYTGGFAGLGLAAVIVIAYIWGKKYMAHGSWFFNRPIQTAVVYAALLFSIVGSTKMGAVGAGMTTMMTDSFKFENILGLLIALGLGYYAYNLYKEEVESGNVKVNMVLLGFPVLLLLNALLVNYMELEYGYVLIALYGLALGANYVKEGLEMKYPPLIIVGTITVLTIVYLKIALNLDDIVNEVTPTLIGLLLIIAGAIMIGAMMYLRKEWLVNDANVEGEFNPAILDDMKGGMSGMKGKFESMQKKDTPSEPKAETPPPPSTPPSDSGSDDSSDAPDSSEDDAPEDKA